MLERLLRLAAARGSVDLRALAYALHVSPRQVGPMLDTLVRLGYVEEVAAGCDQPCESCPLQAVCASRSRPRLWRLAAKGAP
jgi:predicted ArsR family transcriptional regulator